MNTPQYTRVSEDVFSELSKQNRHVPVRKFQSGTGDEHFSVMRDEAGQVVDLVHDFVPIF